MVKPTPTKRSVIEPSYKCNIKCKFCYHLYKDWSKYDKTLDELKKEVDDSKARGNNYIDITGGEPTIYPQIVDLVKYIKSKDMGCCIITNGLANIRRTQEILDAGIDDWLVSIHNLKEKHDLITNTPGSFNRQLAFIDQIGTFRVNCVINKHNQDAIWDISNYISKFDVKIINFINFNPHGEWMEKGAEASGITANLKGIKDTLEHTINYLEYLDIGVNLRYYPMCCVVEKHRKNICNDLHVTFDPYEWDYAIQPKTFDSYLAWGQTTSNDVENKDEPCGSCDLKNVCGGINKKFNEVTNGKHITKIIDSGLTIDDMKNFYFYRQHNERCLMELNNENM